MLLQLALPQKFDQLMNLIVTWLIQKLHTKRKNSYEESRAQGKLAHKKGRKESIVKLYLVQESLSRSLWDDEGSYGPSTTRLPVTDCQPYRILVPQIDSQEKCLGTEPYLQETASLDPRSDVRFLWLTGDHQPRER